MHVTEIERCKQDLCRFGSLTAILSGPLKCIDETARRCAATQTKTPLMVRWRWWRCHSPRVQEVTDEGSQFCPEIELNMTNMSPAEMYWEVILQKTKIGLIVCLSRPNLGLIWHLCASHRLATVFVRCNCEWLFCVSVSCAVCVIVVWLSVSCCVCHYVSLSCHCRVIMPVYWGEAVRSLCPRCLIPGLSLSI